MKLGNRHAQHSFAQVPSVHMARSTFDRSHAVKDTMNFDLLTPIYVDEVLPGDTINLNVLSFHRLATQVVPFMDNAYLDWYFFFVPNRLVWDNWEKFNGAQDNPNDSTDYLVPHIPAPPEGFAVGSIYDKFGIPTDISGLEINALPFRAYNLIYNTWFRDQNLINSITVPKGDGPDSDTTYVLKKAAKKHDYFTSMLPWPQKGDPVSLPLGGGNLPLLFEPDWDQDRTRIYDASPGGSPPQNLTAGALNSFNDVIRNPSSFQQAVIDVTEHTYGDLSQAIGPTINAFRQAIMLQSLLELDARGGTRYVEILKAHFNVISPDFRLQRPEFLAGTTTTLQQHVIPQTSGTPTDGSGDPTGSPQANLASYSTASTGGSQVGFSKSFVEHGYVIGLIRARGENTYQQGINKMWLRKTRWDFFWPKLQELGEQAVLLEELYATGTANDKNVIGYQERHAEYRYKPSEIRGQFRSTYSESLDVWHLAEHFETAPALNQTFIEQNTPIERSLVLPDDDYPHLLCDYFFQQRHARPMVVKAVPATLGRF